MEGVDVEEVVLVLFRSTDVDFLERRLTALLSLTVIGG